MGERRGGVSARDEDPACERVRDGGRRGETQRGAAWREASGRAGGDGGEGHNLEGGSKEELTAPTAALYIRRMGQKKSRDAGEMPESLAGGAEAGAAGARAGLVVVRVRKTERLREKMTAMHRRRVFAAEAGRRVDRLVWRCLCVGSRFLST